MALVVKDRVRETTTTGGTGDIILAGAVASFQDFSVIGDGNTTYYTIVDPTTGDWEVGIGTYTAGTTTLSRDTILESSNGGSAVNFSTDIKDVFVTYPAERSVYIDGTEITPAISATLEDIPIGDVTPNTGAFTELTSSSTTSLNGTTIPASKALVTTDDTQTLTNKTITSPSISSPTITGDLSIADKIVHTGDTNTAIRFPSNDTVAIETAGSERLRVDSSGNVGIGTTTPSGKLNVAAGSSGASPWANADDLVVETNGATGISILASDSSQANLIFGSPSDNIGSIVRWIHDDGEFQIGSHTANGFLIFKTAIGQERMRITNSGNVGIGTTNPSVKLHVTGATNSKYMEVGASNRTLNFSCFATTADNAGHLISVDSTAGVLAFGIVDDEAMRIDSGGSVYIGTTSGNFNTGLKGIRLLSGGSMSTRSSGVNFFSKEGTGTVLDFRYFVNSSATTNTVVGSISITTTSTAYNTSSDYRLKENVIDLDNAIDRLKQIPVHRFNFIADPDTVVDGFLAHEVQPFVPEAVTGTKDGMQTEEYQVEPAKGEIFIPAIEEVLDEEGEVVTPAQDEQIIASDVEQPETLEDGQQWRETTPKVMGEREVPEYQGIDQSKLVPLLTAALQDAIKRIEELEAKVNV